MVLGVFGLDSCDYGNQIAIQGLAWLQRTVRELRERRRHDAGARLKRDVVTSPAKGNSATPQIQGAVARCAMHGAKMECGAVTGLQIERDNWMLVPFSIYVRHDLKAVSAHRIIVTDEHLWLKQTFPTM